VVHTPKIEAGAFLEKHHWLSIRNGEIKTNESRFCPASSCTYTHVAEQTLPAKCWLVTRSKHLYIMTLSSVVSCIIIAVIVIVDSMNIVEQAVRYDNIPGCKVGNEPATALPKICSFQVTVEQDFPAPVYFYYSFTNFNQNHRRYVKSLSSSQLMGSDKQDLDFCEPEETRTYLNKRIYPCGLHAYTFPPDRISVEAGGEELCPVCNFTLDAVNRSSVWETDGTWVKDNIAWDTDVSEKFSDKANPGVVRSNLLWNETYGLIFPRVDDQDFIVWMRSALLSDFRKLYRVSETRSLNRGEMMTVTISNYWDNSKYETEKWLVFSTVGSLGGDNSSLVAICAFTAMISLSGMVLVLALRSTDRATIHV